MAQLTSKDLNIQIVSMRKEVRKAVTHRIHGLSQKARMLRLKKGTDEQKQKNENKAEHYVSEIQILKKFKPDEVSLYALSNPSVTDLKHLLAKPVITDEAKAMAKLCLRDNMRQSVDEFISRYKDSMDLLNDLISERYSNIGKEKKKRKKMRGKKKKTANKNAETNKAENDITDQDKTNNTNVQKNKTGNKNTKQNKDQNKNINTISKVAPRKSTQNKQEIDGMSESDESIPELTPIPGQSSDDDDDIFSQDESNASSNEDDSQSEGSDDEGGDNSGDESKDHSHGEGEENSDVEAENDSDDETEGNSDDDDVSDTENLTNSKKSYKANIFKPNLKPKQTNPKMSKLSNMSSKAQFERKKVDPFFKTANDSEYLTYCDISNKVAVDDRDNQSHYNDSPDRNSRDSFRKGFRENRPFKKDFNNRKPFDRNSNNRQPYNRSSFNKRPYNRNSDDKQPFKRKFSDDPPFRKGFTDSKFPKRNFQDKNQRNWNDRSNNFKSNDRKRSEPSTETNVKLHPSWEAKKKINQAPTAFQGKKTVFDD